MISKAVFNTKIRDDFDDSDTSLNDQKEKEQQMKEIQDEPEEIININTTSVEDSPIIREGRRLLLSLNNKITCDAIFKIKEFLLQRTAWEIEIIRKEVIKVFHPVHKYIWSNLDDGTLYNVFKSYKDLLIEIKNNEKLGTIFKFNDEILDEYIEILDEKMKETIQRQEKMKKSRKNLKEKLRLQRRLNEVRNKCSEMDEDVVKNEKFEGKIEKEEQN
jgi:hypothetical protein